ALVQDGAPAQARLEAFQAQLLEQVAVVADRPAPLKVVVVPVALRMVHPGAARQAVLEIGAHGHAASSAINVYADATTPRQGVPGAAGLADRSRRRGAAPARAGPGAPAAAGSRGSPSRRAATLRTRGRGWAAGDRWRSGCRAGPARRAAPRSARRPVRCRPCRPAGG